MLYEAGLSLSLSPPRSSFNAEAFKLLARSRRRPFSLSLSTAAGDSLTAWPGLALPFLDILQAATTTAAKKRKEEGEREAKKAPFLSLSVLLPPSSFLCVRCVKDDEEEREGREGRRIAAFRSLFLGALAEREREDGEGGRAVPSPVLGLSLFLLPSCCHKMKYVVVVRG